MRAKRGPNPELMEELFSFSFRFSGGSGGILKFVSKYSVPL